MRDITDRMMVQEREGAAAARALLLQEVTADFFAAWTLDEVRAVLAVSLERVGEIFREGVELQVPGDLATMTDGGMLVASTQRALSHAEWQLLNTLASQCAIAAQARHAPGPHRRHRRAAAVQPGGEPPARPREVRARGPLRPERRPLEHVGGAWYDAFRTPTGMLALVVGDVMGRGVRAATTMIRVRAGIRGLLTVDPAPQAVLSAADEMMTRDAPDQFVTAAAVLVDPATGTLTLCNAGHVPVVVVHPDGSTETLDTGPGVPLGVLRSQDRTATTAHVGPGRC